MNPEYIKISKYVPIQQYILMATTAEDIPKYKPLKRNVLFYCAMYEK